MITAVTTRLLEFLVNAAACKDRGCSALAIEGLAGMQRARNKLQEEDAMLPAEAEFALLPALLAHARYPSEADEDLDDEEWARVREEVIQLACLQSYCVLRITFVRHCCEALETSMEAGDWRGAEAGLFALAACAGPLKCRLEMQKAEQAAEREECNALLHQLLGACSSLDVPSMVGGCDDEEEAATAVAALHAAMARVVASFIEWLFNKANSGAQDASTYSELLLSVAGNTLTNLLELPGWSTHMLIEHKDHDETRLFALREHLKHSAGAANELFRKARASLTMACDADDEWLGRVVAAGARWGGRWVDPVGFSACRLLAGLGDEGRRTGAIGAVFDALATRLETIVSEQGAGAGGAVDGGAAESAGLLCHMGAALQGLSMCGVLVRHRIRASGRGDARLVMQRAGDVLKVVATWNDPNVASAMSSLMCGVVGVVENGGDAAMLDFVSEVSITLAAHHPSAALAVASVLTQTQGQRGRDVREAECAPMAAAITALGRGIGSSLEAAQGKAVARAQAEGAGRDAGDVAITDTMEDIVSSLQAAAVYLVHVPFLLVESGSVDTVAAALALYCRRPEPAILDAALRCLHCLKMAVRRGHNEAQATGGESAPWVGALVTALQPHVADIGTGLAGQLCGRCGEEFAAPAARVMHWAVQMSGDEGANEQVAMAVMGGLEAAGAGKFLGDGSVMMNALLRGEMDDVVVQGTTLWGQMR